MNSIERCFFVIHTIIEEKRYKIPTSHNFYYVNLFIFLLDNIVFFYILYLADFKIPTLNLGTFPHKFL